MLLPGIAHCIAEGKTENQEKVSYEVKEHSAPLRSWQVDQLPQAQAQEGHLAWKPLPPPTEAVTECHLSDSEGLPLQVWHCHHLLFPDEKTEAQRDLRRVTMSVTGGSETDSKSPAVLPPGSDDNWPFSGFTFSSVKWAE